MNASAFFGDQETSEANIFGASSLGIALTVSSDSGDYRELTVDTDGAEDLEYRLSLSVSGDAFCNDLDVRIKRNGVDLYTGSLANYMSSSAPLLANDSEDWVFNYDLANTSSVGGSCIVVTTFEANQSGYNHGQAFFDTETYTYTLTGDDFGVVVGAPEPTIPTGVFINEVLANPAGDEHTDERIELYNNSGVAVSLTDWYIVDASANTIDIPDSLLAHGAFLVVTAHDLNNSADTLTLYDNTNTERDSFAYSDASDANEGATASRCPDGSSVTEPTNATLGTENDCATTTSAFTFLSSIAEEPEKIDDPLPPPDEADREEGSDDTEEGALKQKEENPPVVKEEESNTDQLVTNPV